MAVDLVSRPYREVAQSQQHVLKVFVLPTDHLKRVRRDIVRVAMSSTGSVGTYMCGFGCFLDHPSHRGRTHAIDLATREHRLSRFPRTVTVASQLPGGLRFKVEIGVVLRPLLDSTRQGRRRDRRDPSRA